MHNIHIITLVHKKNDLEGAAELALNNIEDWGSENNWREWSDIVSESSKYLYNKDFRRGSWLCPNKLKTNYIKQAKEYIYNIVLLPEEYLKEAFNRVIPEILEDKIKKLSYYDIYNASKYLREVAEQMIIDKNIWDLSYMSGHYDECGVTCMIYDEPNEDEERYIVFIDMHS